MGLRLIYRSPSWKRKLTSLSIILIMWFNKINFDAFLFFRHPEICCSCQRSPETSWDISNSEYIWIYKKGLHLFSIDSVTRQYLRKADSSDAAINITTVIGKSHQALRGEKMVAWRCNAGPLRCLNERLYEVDLLKYLRCGYLLLLNIFLYS